MAAWVWANFRESLWSLHRFLEASIGVVYEKVLVLKVRDAIAREYALADSISSAGTQSYN
jgi:hypothetical protein